MSLEPVARAVCEANRLTFVRFVGAGAFKETFEVRVGGVSHALKVYNASNNPERAAREVEAMTRCSHPGIGRLVSLATHEDAGVRHVYSLEEFLGGGTLSERLASGSMKPSEVHALGVALIDAIAHIASLDLVHRDLKPDNIMFREDGTTPVVVDFGLVRDLGARSLTQTFVMQGPGTPLFAPPEQLLNDKGLIDWRSDQFSLGVLLSICALGAHPYHVDGDVPMEIVTRVAGRNALPESYRQACKAAGLTSLAKMVEPWPVQRYRTPDLLARAWATQEPTSSVVSTIAPTPRDS